MNIKELNEELEKFIEEDENEKAIQELNNKLYEIVPYVLCRTKDTGLLEYIYAYFDERYKVAWQGGLRNDDRGMVLCYWIDSDNPDTLCLYLDSDHNNLFMSGSTHWEVPAKTFEDKVNVIKQIKQDIDKIVEDNDKFPKTFYGGAWSDYGHLMCSLYVSDKFIGNIGTVYLQKPRKDNPKWEAQIMCPYCNERVEGDSETVLDELKEKIKDRVILELVDTADINNSI